jgi:hypothetical protein
MHHTDLMSDQPSEEPEAKEPPDTTWMRETEVRKSYSADEKKDRDNKKDRDK